MTIEKIVFEIADTLRQESAFAGCPVIEQHQGDVENEVELAVGKAGTRCALVGFNGAENTVQGTTAPKGGIVASAKFFVCVFGREEPSSRRALAPGILALARKTANLLQGAAAAGMADTLKFKRLGPVIPTGERDDGLLTCTVEFETKAEI